MRLLLLTMLAATVAFTAPAAGQDAGKLGRLKVALVPPAPDRGAAVVGTWKGDYTSGRYGTPQYGDFEVTFVFNDDGTVTTDDNVIDQGGRREGTWKVDGGEVVITWTRSRVTVRLALGRGTLSGGGKSVNTRPLGTPWKLSLSKQ